MTAARQAERAPNDMWIDPQWTGCRGRPDRTSEGRCGARHSRLCAVPGLAVGASVGRSASVTTHQHGGFPGCAEMASWFSALNMNAGDF